MRTLLNFVALPVGAALVLTLATASTSDASDLNVWSFRLDLLMQQHRAQDAQRNVYGCDKFLALNGPFVLFCDQEDVVCSECNGPLRAWISMYRDPGLLAPFDKRLFTFFGDADQVWNIIGLGRQDKLNCSVQPYAVGTTSDPLEEICGAYLRGSSIGLSFFKSLIPSNRKSGSEADWWQMENLHYAIIHDLSDPVSVHSYEDADPWHKRFMLAAQLWAQSTPPTKVTPAELSSTSLAWLEVMARTWLAWMSYEKPDGDEWMNLVGVEPLCDLEQTACFSPDWLLDIYNNTLFIGDDPLVAVQSTNWSGIKRLYR